MTERVTEVSAEQIEQTIERPVIIVHMLDDDRVGVILHIAELDRNADQPKRCGIVLSDVLDHIAAAYNRVSGRDPRDIRAEILKVLKDEDRFKTKDPTRGNLIGASIKPTNLN